MDPRSRKLSEAPGTDLERLDEILRNCRPEVVRKLWSYAKKAGGRTESLVEDAVNRTWAGTDKDFTKVQARFLRITDNPILTSEDKQNQVVALWLCIAKCRLIEMLRKKTEKTNNSRIDLATIIFLLAARDDDPAQQAIKAEEVEIVSSCLSQLEASQRKLCQMYFFDDLKQTEIGEIFGMNKDKVSKEIARAKKELISCLKRHGLTRD